MLDVRSESLIRDTLLELKQRMTIIVIAHRLTTLGVCDRIMVIQDGEMKGFDTPTTLERSSDFYREALELSRYALMGIPDFFILGAGRSGTTSLARVLGSHPQVFVPDMKEPASRCVLSVDREPGDSPPLYAGAQEQFRGDASHIYLEDPRSAETLPRSAPTVGS